MSSSTIDRLDPLILLTGAAGKTGQALLRALTRRGQAVRALAFRNEQVSMLEELGAREVVVGDVRHPETVAAATEGTRAIYHICPNMHPEEIAIGEGVIAAAKAAGIEHFVYHSVLHPQTEAMPHHWHKLRVEEKLLESGLACTILQPAAYMQNLLSSWTDIVERGFYTVPYAAETRITMVELRDVAEAAAEVLTEPGHVGATYELCGPDYLSQHEVAAILGERLRREVHVEVIPIKTWKRQANASGLGELQIETLIKMFRYYGRHGFRGNPSVLGWLLDRPPAGFRWFVERAFRDHKTS